MIKLDYAGGEVIISNELSHALLDFAADVARAGGSVNLRVPMVTTDGLRGEAEMVIGPASQLIAIPSDTAEIDLHDESVIADIRARSAAFQPSKALPLADADLGVDFDQ
jgi:hypothetical protein